MKKEEEKIGVFALIKQRENNNHNKVNFSQLKIAILSRHYEKWFFLFLLAGVFFFLIFFKFFFVCRREWKHQQQHQQYNS